MSDEAKTRRLSGIVSITASAPIERIKLLLQCQNEIIKQGRLDTPYKGITDCVTKIYKNEGILKFWRGNMASCIQYFPTQFLNFAFKDWTKKLLNPRETDSHIVRLRKNIISGGLAGAITISFVYSLTYAHVRLANDIKYVGKTGKKRKFRGIVDVYKKTLKSDGWVGLYRGFVVSCVGIVVYRGLYFGLYDTLEPILLKKDASGKKRFVLGWFVTCSAGLTAYPLDTIRCRMIMTSGEVVKYKGAFDCCFQIIEHEGYRALMRGAGVSLLRGFAGAGAFVFYNNISTPPARN